jgi:hypothetical protein
VAQAFGLLCSDFSWHFEALDDGLPILLDIEVAFEWRVAK